LFKDFFQYFYKITINYTKSDYHLVSHATQGVSNKFGVCRLMLPEDTKMSFVSLFQMNMKFFDYEEYNKEQTVDDHECTDKCEGFKEKPADGTTD
jgi:hypothetical protein